MQILVQFSLHSNTVNFPPALCILHGKLKFFAFDLFRPINRISFLLPPLAQFLVTFEPECKSMLIYVHTNMPERNFLKLSLKLEFFHAQPRSKTRKFSLDFQ